MPTKITTQDYIKKAIEKYGDLYDYTDTEYIDSRNNITFKCNKCKNLITVNAKSHLKNSGCTICNKNTPLTTETFIQKAKVKFGDKYDYSSTIYIDSKTNVEINCPKHGIFTMLPTTHYSEHLNGNCKYCDSKDKKQNKFIENSKKVYGENTFDYSLVDYICPITPITLICKKEHRFTVIPKLHLTKKENCKKCCQDYYKECT